MTFTLREIAGQLQERQNKVQLVYAFNSSGKTRLSRDFVDLITSKEGDGGEPERSRNRILYYNDHTEDLFYWDNDHTIDSTPRLRIQPNSFTNWVLEDQGKAQDIVTTFQRYASDRITPVFNAEYLYEEAGERKIIVPKNSEVTFRYNTKQTMTEGKEDSLPEDGETIVSGHYEFVKISKGEESNFIWSIFFTLIDQVVTVLNEQENDDPVIGQFRNLEYIFIDDPVSSLDENHLIELAVSLADLVRQSKSALRFVITTHNPLFYNVLYRELNLSAGFLLERLEDETFDFKEKEGSSNQSFSYHLHLKKTLEKAIANNKVEKYHFTLLRNLYEKTANFLGYKRWRDLLETVPGDKEAYLRRIITYSSHRTLSNEEVSEPSAQEKQTVELLLKNLNSYGYLQEG